MLKCDIYLHSDLFMNEAFIIAIEERLSDPTGCLWASRKTFRRHERKNKSAEMEYLLCDIIKCGLGEQEVEVGSTLYFNPFIVDPL